MKKTTAILTTRRKERAKPGFGRTDPRRIAFSRKILDGLAKDMTSGNLPLHRVVVSDDEANGLRAIIYKNGAIAFFVQYTFGNSRPQMKIGNFPDLSIDDARKLTNAVRSLADQGIDPQEGLHDRLVRELLEKGDRWRP